MDFTWWPHYPSTLASNFGKSLHKKFFQGGLKSRPRQKRVKFTTVVLHKLKWVSHLEKYVEKTFELGPNDAHGCHLQSLGLTPGLLNRNAILRICRIWAKICQKLSSCKISQDQNCSNEIFLLATLSQQSAKQFSRTFSLENFSVRAEIVAWQN